MRLRAFICVTGPAWAGKTTFIEDLLQSLGELVICVRAERDDSLGAPKESAPRTHEELRRYADAGACAVARFRFPEGPPGAAEEAFFQARFMEEYSTAVIIEGDCPLGFVDLTVFVAPALPAGQSLLVRAKRDLAAENAAFLDTWEAALESPAALARFVMRGFDGHIQEALLAHPDILEQTRGQMRGELDRLRAAPPPEPTEHWAIAPGYEGIERSGLVVVNARDADPRERCEALVKEVARLRKDAEVFGEVIGPLGKRTPITAVVARLGTPRDPGLKKALARVKRAIENA